MVVRLLSLTQLDQALLIADGPHSTQSSVPRHGLAGASAGVANLPADLAQPWQEARTTDAVPHTPPPRSCVARSAVFVRAGRRSPTSPPFDGALRRIHCPTPVAW
jgi:hypothetical protein